MNYELGHDLTVEPAYQTNVHLADLVVFELDVAGAVFVMVWIFKECFLWLGFVEPFLLCLGKRLVLAGVLYLEPFAACLALVVAGNKGKGKRCARIHPVQNLFECYCLNHKSNLQVDVGR